MEPIAKYLAHNDYWTAAATVGGVISLIITIRQPIMRLYRYVSQVIHTSLDQAEKMKRMRRAFMAVRCVSNPSYFIACLIQMTAQPVMHSAIAFMFAAQGAVDVFVSPIFTGRHVLMMTVVTCLLIGSAVLALATMFSDIVKLSFAVTQVWHRSDRRRFRRQSRSG